MEQKREGQLDAYLRALNKAYVTRDGESLCAHYTDERDRMADRDHWMRKREQDRMRDIRPLAGRLTALPLYRAVIGCDQAETAMVLHHQLHYRQRGASFVEENRRIQRISMRRQGDEWAMLWPWGWYFDGHHLEAPQRATESAAPTPPASEETGEGGFLAADQDGPAGEGPLQPVQGTIGGGYDRERAVAYAERYWNTPNPAYPYFQVDCTNFVSQCLHAGGIPMHYTGSRGSGWWMRGGSWSYSWAVAHSLYLLLKSGAAPMRATEVADPSQLEPGDVICYDFDGDGRWQHNTIVVARDANGMPLVNAHTTNSRHRYWAYRDSSAYTPNIRYGFFHIRG